MFFRPVWSVNVWKNNFILWYSITDFIYPCFGLRLDFLQSISNCISFLSFTEITHAYLLKILITHNKKRIPLSNLLINCISARSGLQILSIKRKYTFNFSYFLIIGSWVILQLILGLLYFDLSPHHQKIYWHAWQKVFYQNTDKTMKHDPFLTHHKLDF